MSNFRPTKLKEIVGCDHIKEAINVAIEASRTRNDAVPHILLYGPPGLGKTTISNAIAHERGGELKILLADIIKGRVDVQNLMASLNHENHNDLTEIEDNGQTGTPKIEIVGEIKPTFIFLDEIHMLPRSTQEAFFQPMEENLFTLDTVNRFTGTREKRLTWVPKFTLIGATTRAGDLDRAFVERFKLVFTLHLYSEEELCKIIENYCLKMNIAISIEAILAIAKRSRGTPRKAINYIERSKDMALYTKNELITTEIVERTFDTLQVDKAGLEPLDGEVLSYLYKIYPRKVGVARLASILSMTENVLKEIVEPYLLRQNLIEATPSGRMITELGMIYCEKNGLVKKDGNLIKNSRRVTSNV